MRITEGMRQSEVLRNLGRLQSQHADATREATTGARIDRPSKDPTGAAELARIRATLSRGAAHQEAVNLVRGDAELAESTLAEGTDLMTRAREIALSGANGVLTQSERSVLAIEARSLKDELVRLANSKGTKGYIFGGSATATTPFAANGSFSGNDQPHLVDIGTGAPVEVGASGARAFTSAGGRDVFAELDALATALDNNDPSAVAATLDGLAASREQLTNERSRVGLLVGRLDTSTAVLGQLELEANRRQEQVGAADPFDAYSRMSSLGSAIERSVAVSRQIFELTGVARF